MVAKKVSLLAETSLLA